MFPDCKLIVPILATVVVLCLNTCVPESVKSLPVTLPLLSTLKLSVCISILLPVIRAEVAVKAPPDVTLNGLFSPKEIPSVPA